jgi:hypothetical protein
MWNMLSGYHLFENMIFIEYLCEICSICKNMVIWCLDSVSKVCAISEILCSICDGHYTESGNCSIFDEEKGRHALAMYVSHRRQRETRTSYTRLTYEAKGDTLYSGTSPIYLTPQKRLPTEYSSQDASSARIFSHIWLFVEIYHYFSEFKWNMWLFIGI